MSFDAQMDHNVWRLKNYAMVTNFNFFLKLIEFFEKMNMLF